MDFHQFTKQIKSSAALAATAAMAFKNFDEMAANDEYIHSNGLNVKTKSTSGGNSRSRASAENTPETLQEVVELAPLSAKANQELNYPISTKGYTDNLSDDLPFDDELRKRPEDTTAGDRSASHEIFHQKKAVARPLEPLNRLTPQRQSTMPAYTSVDELGHAWKKSESLPEHFQLVNENDEERGVLLNGSFDDDDPVISHLRMSGMNSAATKGQFVGGGDLESQDVETANSKPRNKNRFMEDLEDRLSKPQSTIVMPVSSQRGEKEEVPLPDQLESVAVLGSWLQSFRSNSKHHHGGGLDSKAAPLSRKKKQREAEPSFEDETFSLVGSISMLGKDDLEALEQLKQGSNRSYLLLCFDLFKDHPRETFVVLTLVLGAIAYFYSRRVTPAEDV